MRSSATSTPARPGTSAWHPTPGTPPSAARRRRPGTRAGPARTRSTCAAAGTTRATTASTSSTAGSPCTRCSTRGSGRSSRRAVRRPRPVRSPTAPPRSRRRATVCRTSSTRPAGSSSGCSGCRCPRATSTPGLVFHKVQDDGWTGLPLAPDEDPQTRQVHRPSTAATLNLAAVAAKGARLWEPYDEEFAASLLESARTAWAAAVETPDLYASALDGNEGGGPYDDKDVSDEFYWAAAELYLTTGDDEFADAVTGSPVHSADLAGRGRVRLAAHRGPRPDGPRAGAQRAARPRRGARLGGDARRLRALPAGQGVLRAAVPAVRRPVRVGLQRDHPQQRGDPGRRRRRSRATRSTARPRWRAWTTCWAATRSTSPT